MNKIVLKSLFYEMYTVYSHVSVGTILYLQVYDLGHDGQGMSRVASVSQNSIVSAAGNIAR